MTDYLRVIGAHDHGPEATWSSPSPPFLKCLSIINTLPSRSIPLSVAVATGLGIAMGLVLGMGLGVGMGSGAHNWYASTNARP